MEPHVAEPLAVVTLREVGLIFVCFYLYKDVEEVGKCEEL
jgi:hypothetical protein